MIHFILLRITNISASPLASAKNWVAPWDLVQNCKCVVTLVMIILMNMIQSYIRGMLLEISLKVVLLMISFVVLALLLNMPLQSIIAWLLSTMGKLLELDPKWILLMEKTTSKPDGLAIGRTENKSINLNYLREFKR